MSTRNRPSRLTVEAGHLKGSRDDAEEPHSETLPKINTQAILDTYDPEESIVIVCSRFSICTMCAYCRLIPLNGLDYQASGTNRQTKQAKQSGKQKLRVQEQLPQVQDDVFYDQPLPDRSKLKQKDVAVPGSGAIDPPGMDPVVRDVRFSSPLEGARQTNTTGSQPSKSSLKKGATSRPARIQVQAGASGLQQEEAQVLTIVVNPVSQRDVRVDAWN